MSISTIETTSNVQTLTFAKAITEGLRAAMAADAKVLVQGEDIGQLGGVFRITDGLFAEFGESRVIDTPLAESGIVGTAIGLALRGYRPVCEIQFDGFVYSAFDQITSQLARLHYRSAGRVTVPVVVRIPYGGGIGAVEHHSESPEAYFAHTPGLRVVSPANPQDAYEMIQAAIACPDPVIFFEPKGRYWTKGEVTLSSPSSSDILNTARIARAGSDVTLVAYGPSVTTAMEAAAVLDLDGVSAEVVDLRALSPLDLPTVIESVKRTGRCIVIHEATAAHGIGAEVATRVTEAAFHSLEAPVLRVAGFHTPYPVAKIEHDFLPSVDRIVDAVDRSFEY
jgi:pyruvate dehydrogenase E1 component beta subunit